MCRTYKVTRSGYYGWRQRRSSPRQTQNQELSARIAAIYDASDMQRRLAQLGIVQSMNRPEAKMTDNALMESFFHSMKAEGVHGRTFPDQQRLDQHVNRYMPFYNGQRMHSALGYASPVVFEQQFLQNSVST